MKKAVAHLMPVHRDASKRRRAARSNGKIVMATVKGDVHDIGKNIVGVVLQCNNFEVIDLGVMVPCADASSRPRSARARHDRPLGPDHAVARRDGARRAGDGAAGFQGAAADRRRHDVAGAHAVKIEPNYKSPSVYVKDASRAVGVCQSLITPRAARDEYIAQAQATITRRVASSTAGSKVKAPALSLAQARANRFRCDWAQLRAAGAAIRSASRVFDDYPLDELVRYIDWMPFFNAWEFAGKFPDVLTDPVVGDAASNLYADARRC